MSMNEEEMNRRYDVRLAAMGALLGHITANIDAIIVDWGEQKIDLYFVFDSTPVIGNEDYENVEDVKKKMQQKFPFDTIILHCLQADSKEFPVKKGEAVYIRKLS